ncbi:hypothetical protein [Variovorax sp. Root473]|uniref:hypothetical protein n=1 Tax=Variovorax sp. Root473 TaxID=1736541 RepID=UPI0006F34BAA|nr:hypothetical protein [Variovorax sp. Root473]KQX91193.1 hypothetical protein ASD34_25400 [Variovorax sp. Root473]
MEKLAEFFVQNATTDKMWIAFLALAIYYVLKKEPFKVFEHFSQKQEKEHTLAKELLETGRLTKDANEFLREHLEHYAFKRYYGISADAEMRIALVKFQKKHQREISWAQLRRAYTNIKLSDTKLEARLGWIDHAFRWFVTILCWATGGYALVVIGLAAYAGSQFGRLQFFGLTIVALMLLLAAMFFSSMNWPYHNTRAIMKLLKKEK